MHKFVTKKKPKRPKLSTLKGVPRGQGVGLQGPRGSKGRPSGSQGVRFFNIGSGRVLDKIPGSGSGPGRVGVSKYTIGYFRVFWVFPGMSGIFRYFWVYPYNYIFSNIYFGPKRLQQVYQGPKDCTGRYRAKVLNGLRSS